MTTNRSLANFALLLLFVFVFDEASFAYQGGDPFLDTLFVIIPSIGLLLFSWPLVLFGFSLLQAIGLGILIVAAFLFIAPDISSTYFHHIPRYIHPNESEKPKVYSQKPVPLNLS